MSAPTSSGRVFLDPRLFYPALGAAKEGVIPLYDSATGGAEVGSFDLATGDLNLIGEPKSTQPKSTMAVEP